MRHTKTRLSVKKTKLNKRRYSWDEKWIYYDKKTFLLHTRNKANSKMLTHIASAYLTLLCRACPNTYRLRCWPWSFGLTDSSDWDVCSWIEQRAKSGASLSPVPVWFGLGGLDLQQSHPHAWKSNATRSDVKNLLLSNILNLRQKTILSYLQIKHSTKTPF